MHLAAALLTLALAAPVDAGAPEPLVGATISLEIDAWSLDHADPRSSRARAPLTPAMRRLLRKRDLLAPVDVGEGRFLTDRTLSLLALDLGRSSTCLLGRARSLEGRDPVPLRLLLAGIEAHALRTPPPAHPR